MQFFNKKHKRIQINITSLIDVLFLLLIFFMVSSTFLEQPGMKLQLPKSTQMTTSKITGHTVYITKDERVFYNEELIPAAKLKEKMKEISSSIGEESLVLKADDKVRYGFVVEVMDMIKTAGIRNITIATELKQQNEEMPGKSQ